MEEKKRDIALRSEKMTAIVGRIPPALLRYGTAAIVGALVVLIAIGFLLPYRRVYTGRLTFYEVPGGAVRVKMYFEGSAPASIDEGGNAFLSIAGDTVSVEAKLLSLSAARDTLCRQWATIELHVDSTRAVSLSNQTYSFTMVEEQGTIARKILKW